MTGSIRVLLVDDSPTVLLSLSGVLSRTGGFTVVGTLSDGRQVLETVLRERPDVIVLDLDLGQTSGVEVTRQVMEQVPTPILIVTSVSRSSGPGHFQALSAGAVDILGKDRLVRIEEDEAVQKILCRRVRIVAGVAVIRRPRSLAGATPPPPAASPPRAGRAVVRVVAVAASTGGPPAVQRLVGALDPTRTVPLVVVQHMGEEFVDGFVNWLSMTTRWRASVLREGDELAPGVVHVAPGDRHVTVDAKLVAHLDQTVPVNACRPSADRLFASLANSVGPGAIGVILSGMGKDGAAGLSSLRRAGALTIAQDEATSIVFGMPGEAVRLGAASIVAPLDRIAPLIADAVRRSGGEG